MSITVSAVASPSSTRGRFMAVDEDTGITGKGATPQYADIDVQNLVRQAGRVQEEADFANSGKRTAAALAHNQKRQLPEVAVQP